MNSKPFIRKIIYIAIIGALLIPLSMISRPETRGPDGKIADAGGQLSILREQHDLSQAKMSEIDPASETMKLASLGLRGVAVNMLWMQATEHRKKENFDRLASTLQALTKIQPSFVKVWEHQAHNLAYNVSMEFDDYEYRYQWVKKGIGFLKQGIPYNKRDHRITDQLGFFTGNKIGKSDEKLSFRRMFRNDDDYHYEMSDYIDPDDYYQSAAYGYDNWKMAYQWYDYSRTLVEEKSCRQRRSDLLFYMWRPAQLRNQALGLLEEERPEVEIQEIWERADVEWIDYGNQKISNTLGVTITLEEMAKYKADTAGWREKFDALRSREGSDEATIGEIRQQRLKDLIRDRNISESDMALMELSSDELNDQQSRVVNRLEGQLDGLKFELDPQLLLETRDEDRFEAKKFLDEIRLLRRKMRTIGTSTNTVNYAYWRERTQSESENETLDAHRALYDADEMWRQSIYDDEYDFDYKTKKKTITKRGAITLYEDAFEKWNNVLNKYPELKEGVFVRDLMERGQAYWEMLEITKREWPDDFPLQQLIDERAASGDRDELPTTEMIEAFKSARGSEEEDLESDIDGSKESEQSYGEMPEESDEVEIEPEVTEVEIELEGTEKDIQDEPSVEEGLKSEVDDLENSEQSVGEMLEKSGVESKFEGIRKGQAQDLPIARKKDVGVETAISSRRLFRETSHRASSEKGKSLLYTYNNLSISGLAATKRLDRREITREDMGDFVVFWEAQGVVTRRKSDGAAAKLRRISPKVKQLVSTRWDLLYTTQGPNQPDLLQDFRNRFNGPSWDFIASGDHIKSPHAAAQAEGQSGRGALQAVRKTLEAQGWKFINVRQSRPFKFGLPYEPRVNHAKKQIWFSNLKMNLSDDDWRRAITDYVSAYEKHLSADGVLFQFPKPQHYGNRVSKTLVQHSLDGTVDQIKSRFVTFDHPAETPYEWFKGLERIYWDMRSKTRGLFVVDFAYFGIPVNRYAAQIIPQWAKEKSISLAAARTEFYSSIKAMGDAADYVILADDSREPVDPRYSAPDWVEANFNSIKTINLKSRKS